MKDTSIAVKQLVIPTYPEPAAETLPMFAENRVHQRTSGRPYPNKVVLRVNRDKPIERTYEVVEMENEYIKIQILPEIGGRIYSAYDKTTGYDFFYKQHVIKPALIGVLGSWISGGVEFNWPFHHRGSGFMPCDYAIEKGKDGTVICWLSEHDPIDRMKGMVGIVLRPGEKCFETRMRLYNRTAAPHSFLWWENAAVPVNEKYQIFFPQDVSYVNFHYLKSRTTFPIAGNGIFNGIPMEEARDISWHKNTKPATSYFAAASDFDFFGGYDHGKQCGVVHIGDHHVSPGKKMFTWGYCQLAKSWENALTDTDGQYAELMAGSYSDNQPNFAWLEPYETKEFSQYWYPISAIGVPTFANLKLALKIDRENAVLKLQSTRPYAEAVIRVEAEGKTLLAETCTLNPDVCTALPLPVLPAYVTVTVTAGGATVAEYEEKPFDQYNMPEVITDMPSAAGMNSAQELYLAGVHVDQYRDPAVMPDSYWKEALKRDIHHIPSLIAMAKYELGRYCYESAKTYIERALENICLYNTRVQSGEVYYVYAQILEAMGKQKKAYDYYNKAAWAADTVNKAMTRIAMLDIRNRDYEDAVRHANTALNYGRNNSTAKAVLVIASRALGNDTDALIAEQLAADPLDHWMRYLAGADDLYERMDSDAAQTCFDIAFDMDAMGLYDDILALLEGVVREKPQTTCAMVWYALGYYAALSGKDATDYRCRAAKAPVGKAYPVRSEEMRILRAALESDPADSNAKMLLGCLLYNKRQYAQADALWHECSDYISLRNHAVACFSHLGRREEALDLMYRALELAPDEEELVYETVVLMDKLGIAPAEKIAFLRSHTITRDDCFTELAKAYNQDFRPEDAIAVLMGHEFVPCEGGEHAIADQYLFAHLVIGRRLMAAGKISEALEVFKHGQSLPQSLGAGLWNHCKLVPLKYHQALALEQLGETDEAQEIFRYIATIGIEYFSNMHLKELPYFQANAWRHLGEPLKAQGVITTMYREWQKIIDTKDNGFFGTTPFFISFMDDPGKCRREQYSYLMALCFDAMNRPEKAADFIREATTQNYENLLALTFCKQGFLR